MFVVSNTKTETDRHILSNKAQYIQLYRLQYQIWSSLHIHFIVHVSKLALTCVTCTLSFCTDCETRELSQISKQFSAQVSSVLFLNRLPCQIIMSKSGARKLVQHLCVSLNCFSVILISYQNVVPLASQMPIGFFFFLNKYPSFSIFPNEC